jgi:archaellum component FlaF (FlaF/FlaG flagellin family)
MGLSIAVAGGIICITVLAVFSIVFSLSGQVYEINSSRTKAADIQNTIFQTNMTVDEITAETGSKFVNFTLTNTGNEKLWNYEKFDVVINYTANILGSPTQKTERFTFSSSSDDISIDNISTLKKTCSTCTISHGVAGSNKILIVGVSVGDTTAVSSVTYSGQSLTNIRSDQVSSDNRRSELWYLVNPPSGTADVVVTVGAVESVIIAAMSFNDVHQSSPINTHNGNFDATATTHPSVSLTTTVADALIVDVVATKDGPMTPDTSQTERWELVQANVVGSGSTKQTTTAGAYTMSWTNNGGLDQWAMSAVALRPSDPLCGPSGSFQTNGWTIKSISADYVDPNIINTNEEASICAKLAYPVYTNGFVQVTISTDSGYAKTNSTTAS